MLRAIARQLPRLVKVLARKMLGSTRDRISSLLGAQPDPGVLQRQYSPARTPSDNVLKFTCSAENPSFRHIDQLVLDGARENLIRAYADVGSSLPDPGSRWGSYAACITQNIDKFQTVVEAVGFAQVHVGFEMRAAPPLASVMVQGQLDSLRSAYPAFAGALKACGESPLSDFSDRPPIVLVDGTRYTTSHLAVVGHMFYVAKRLGRLPESVLEIGGGYGAPARAWLTCNLGRLRRFAILDLPESLFFSEVFLKAHFGFEAVVNLADPDAMSRAGLASVVLCPVQRMALLKEFEFDVAINTGSMQEMTDDWITFYMDFLSELKARHFYSANYFLQPISRMNESMNLWAPRLRTDWTLEDCQFYPATPESDFRSSLLAFYGHESEERAPAESVDELIGGLQARIPDDILTQQEGRDIALLMDFFRRRPSIELALSLARVLSGKFPMICKESAFLVNWLLLRRYDLLPQDAREIDMLQARLARLRAAGNEGLV